MRSAELLHPALTYLPQYQTQSSLACGHWASEPCGCDSSAGQCSALSTGSDHTMLEHDTSHWNRGKNHHFRHRADCSHNTGQDTACTEIRASCHGLELILYQSDIFKFLHVDIKSLSVCFKVSLAHALPPTSSKVQDTINIQSNTWVFLTMRAMKNKNSGSTFKVLFSLTAAQIQFLHLQLKFLVCWD